MIKDQVRVTIVIKKMKKVILQQKFSKIPEIFRNRLKMFKNLDCVRKPRLVKLFIAILNMFNINIDKNNFTFSLSSLNLGGNYLTSLSDNSFLGLGKLHLYIQKVGFMYVHVCSCLFMSVHVCSCIFGKISGTKAVFVVGLMFGLCKRNSVFATNPNFLIPIFLEPNVLDHRYLKLWILFDQII